MRISPFAASMFLVSATLGASARRGVASAFVVPSSSATAAARRQFGGSAAVLAAEKNGGGDQKQTQKQGGKFEMALPVFVCCESFEASSWPWSAQCCVYVFCLNHCICAP